jgi:hypothetical protein
MGQGLDCLFTDVEKLKTIVQLLDIRRTFTLVIAEKHAK